LWPGIAGIINTKFVKLKGKLPLNSASMALSPLTSKNDDQTNSSNQAYNTTLTKCCLFCSIFHNVQMFCKSMTFNMQ
jgi:hypothetical protein